MKKQGNKLELNRVTVATLSGSQMRGVAGGDPPEGGHTWSVCNNQCCDTDRFTNCHLISTTTSGA
jgi:hypothetical protein